ncbi:cytochrome ubiquinol oxidase subunit I [Paraferrimonas sp. SM1919]|uniref:cytochrome ubiquinol oxidase subunit I n=1 Tax=Paraferrimonas sp. SM1919 TaxID=2662263 RepID=UPI0013D6DEC6|nr:cytochrome ubiquinol oxidase subunit I [Paraferrimonas sp. SM1919]
MDVLILSRLQFALNISFHILFPTITIALGWFLFFFKVRFMQTGQDKWMAAYRFWVKVFALTFALGVVSGITMSFQFGTNWPGFMEKVGNIAGPLLGYEVLTAFFLEATFLGIMLFGLKRVGHKVHTIATLVVAFGTTMSAFWILSLNSWMHTPTGHEMIDGVAHAKDWSAIIFNPSFPYRLSHVLLSSGLTASFLIIGLSCYRLYKGDKQVTPKLTLKVALFAAAILAPMQIFVGDLHGLNTLKHQPQKIAAMEGLWHTEKGVPLLLFAIPDQEQQTNHFEIAIPNLASIILTHEVDGKLKGLAEFGEDIPPVKPVFFSFRIMVAMGVLMLLMAWYGSVQLLKNGKLNGFSEKVFIAMMFSGWIATLAGWYVTEVGRQPYLVDGILKVSEAVTTVPSSNVLLSFSLYSVIYGVLLVAYIHTILLLARKAINEQQSQGESHV